MRRRYAVFLAIAAVAVVVAAAALFTLTLHPAPRLKLAGVKVLVVVFNGYNPVEYNAVTSTLRGAGAEVVVAKATPEVKVPEPIPSAVPLDEVYASAPEEFDALVIIGGPGVYERVVAKLETGRVDPYVARVGELARRFYERGKLVAAICAAPGVLAEAGVLKGLNATCWPDPRGKLQEIMREGGARLVLLDDTTAPVVVAKGAGYVITGRGPDVANYFAETLVQYLAREVYAG